MGQAVKDKGSRYWAKIAFEDTSSRKDSASSLSGDDLLIFKIFEAQATIMPLGRSFLQRDSVPLQEWSLEDQRHWVSLATGAG